MKATEAYEIAKKCTPSKEEIFAVFVEHVYLVVDHEARRGQFSTNIPLPIKLRKPSNGLTTPPLPTFDLTIRDVLVDRLRADGYGVNENHAPRDPNWSLSISWNKA